MKAVVFAYHNVGAHCLPVLLSHGIGVPLVVTHRDDPGENIWFDSVATVAAQYGIPAAIPDDPNTEEMVARIRALKPDFLFSFYYRQMLRPPLLGIPRHGALNMHGSLLPKYRGRAPVNWAVINGETETGATLHYMVEKPDAGDIVARQAVPILPDDTALDVFNKVTAAAVQVLDRSLPGLLSGTAPRVAQNLSEGSYFGGRKPEDGRIDWRQPAAKIHNLVRGVAPPYPGAFAELGGKTLRILRTRIEPGPMAGKPPGIYGSEDACFAVCSDGGVLRLLEMEYEGRAFTARDFLARFGAESIPLKTARQ